MSNNLPDGTPPQQPPAPPAFPQNPNTQQYGAPQPVVYPQQPNQYQQPVAHPGQQPQYGAPQPQYQQPGQYPQAPLFPNGVHGSQFQPNQQLAARTGRNWAFAIGITVIPIAITGIIIVVMMASIAARY